MPTENENMPVWLCPSGLSQMTRRTPSWTFEPDQCLRRLSFDGRLSMIPLLCSQSGQYIELQQDRIEVANDPDH